MILKNITMFNEHGKKFDKITNEILKIDMI